jgi:hypothetical protein
LRELKLDEIELEIGRPRTEAYIVYVFLMLRGFSGGCKDQHARLLLQCLEGGSLQKSSVPRSKSDKKAHAFTLEPRPDAPCGLFQLLNRRKFTLSALNCAIWVLSNRTILTLSCRQP